MFMHSLQSWSTPSTPVGESVPEAAHVLVKKLGADSLREDVRWVVVSADFLEVKPAFVELVLYPEILDINVASLAKTPSPRHPDSSSCIRAHTAEELHAEVHGDGHHALDLSRGPH